MKNAKWVVVLDSELKHLLPQFIEHRCQDLALIRGSIARSDIAALKKLGHNVIGPSGAFGFEYLVQMGSEIETAVADEDFNALKEIADRYEYFMQNYHIVYRKPEAVAEF